MTTTGPVYIAKLHDASLENGGPDNYKLWYKDYDEYTVTCLGYAGAESIIDTWRNHCTTPPIDKKIKVFDAGCGTGIVAERLISQSGIPRELMEISGGDYSEEMLGLAEKKQIYDRLSVVNLKEKLPYEDNEFDVILSSGVFLQGHCGPECLANIIRVLKPGHLLVATVRTLFYDETKDDWAKQIDACGAELIEEKEIPYLNEVKAICVVIRKK